MYSNVFECIFKYLGFFYVQYLLTDFKNLFMNYNFSLVNSSFDCTKVDDDVFLELTVLAMPNKIAMRRQTAMITIMVPFVPDKAFDSSEEGASLSSLKLEWFFSVWSTVSSGIKAK